MCCMKRTCPTHRCCLPATLSHGRRDRAALCGPFHKGINSTPDLSGPNHFPKTRAPETTVLVDGEESGAQTDCARQSRLNYHLYCTLMIMGWKGDMKGGLAEQSIPIKNSTAYQRESSGKQLTKLSGKVLKGSGYTNWLDPVFPLFNGDFFLWTQRSGWTILPKLIKWWAMTQCL